MVTLSNTGGTVSIEKTGEVYDYSENTDGSFEYYSYMNRDFNVTAIANTYAKGSSDYELQYKDKNVYGTDTTTTYKYIKNVDSPRATPPWGTAFSRVCSRKTAGGTSASWRARPWRPGADTTGPAW